MTIYTAAAGKTVVPVEQPPAAQETHQKRKRKRTVKTEQDATVIDGLRPPTVKKPRKARVKKEQATVGLSGAPIQPAKRKRGPAKKPSSPSVAQDGPKKARKSKSSVLKDQPQIHPASRTTDNLARLGCSEVQDSDTGDSYDDCVLAASLDLLISASSGGVHWREDGFDCMELSAFCWMAPVRSSTLRQ